MNIKENFSARLLLRSPFVVALAFAWPVFVMAAVNADWQPTLVIPASGGFGQSETIRIDLPKNLPADTVHQLAVEMDDIDVTTLVTFTGNQAAFTPTQPLAWGKHQLRLVENTPDGGIVERGNWSLDVRQSKRFREATMQGNATLNGVYRLAENANQANLPKRLQSNGAASVQGAIADDQWRVNARADLLYNSQPLLLPRQRGDIDIGQFLVTATAGALTVNAGHQMLAPDSLIMQGFNRRGVSLSLATSDNSASLTGFELHAQDIVGFQQGLGIGDSNNRVDGFIANYRPLSSDPNALLVSATYLNGIGPHQVGVASVGDPSVSSGRASSVSADGNLLDKRLRLRGEYAATEYNYDYLDPTSQAQSDHAYTALAQYTPWHDKIVGGQPLVFNIGLERSRIGTFFRSLANPTGISDRDALQGIANLSWNSLIAQVVLGHETDNVDDVPLLPHTHTTRSVLTLAYTPQQVPGTNGQLPPMPWYGQPTYSLTYLNVDQVLDKAGTMPMTTGALHATRNLVFVAAFNYTMSNWSITETLGSDDDLMHIGPNTENQQTQINANVHVSDKLTLGPSLQYNQITNKDDANLDSDTTGLGLNLSYAFTPTLMANLFYTRNHQRVRNGSSDLLTQDTTANLSWLVQQANGQKPGITFVLEGLTHKADDQVIASNDVDNYQVNLKVTVSMASGY